MQYSVTLVGVLVALGGTALVNFGFSEACSNEIVAMLPVVAGSVIVWWRRYQVGDISLWGARK